MSNPNITDSNISNEAKEQLLGSDPTAASVRMDESGTQPVRSPEDALLALNTLSDDQKRAIILAGGQASAQGGQQPVAQPTPAELNPLAPRVPT